MNPGQKSRKTKEMILASPMTNYDLLTDEEKAMTWNLGFVLDTSDEHVIEDNAREHDIVLDWDRVNEAISRMEQNTLRLLRDMGFGVSSEGHGDAGLYCSVRFNFTDRKVAEQAAEFGWMADAQERLPIGQNFADDVYRDIPDDIAGLVDVDLYFDRDDEFVREFIGWLEQHNLDRYEHWKEP
jgi:hypothetical protein